MGNLQINTPPPLAASAQRPNRDEAVGAFVDSTVPVLLTKQLTCIIYIVICITIYLLNSQYTMTGYTKQSYSCN